MPWEQNYVPAGNLLVSALIAAIPVVILLGMLGFLHAKAHVAALLGLAASLLIAIVVYGMPVQTAGAAALMGAAFGLFPICWIVIGAIFLYDITVHTGKFEIVKETILGLASDRRVQVLLIAFSFGAFIEGAAGFGTPVAISSAMLIGLGFRPLQAAGLALIGNTAPVAFGALGTPLIALSEVTGLDLLKLSAMVGRQLPFFSLIVPFWVVWAMAGRRATLQVWPACLTAGGSFAITQFLVSNLHGPWLVDIIGAIVSILATILLLRVWQPKTLWRFPHEQEAAGPGRPATSPGPGAMAAAPAHTRREALVAWMPWVLLTVFVFIWGVPQVKDFLNGISVFKYEVPALHNQVVKMPPVVAKPSPEKAVYTFNWLSATGTGLLLAAVLSALLLGIRPARIVNLFGHTLWRTRFSLLTIAAMLALGYTTRYAGLDATMGLGFAKTGFLFTFFSPILGWLGVALTGSDTSSNVLFGGLQKITGQQLGISPILTAASNSSGGVMGKMIDAQSIVVASVATGQHGEEGSILRYVFFHSIVLAALVGVLVFLQANVFPGIVP